MNQAYTTKKIVILASLALALLVAFIFISTHAFVIVKTSSTGGDLLVAAQEKEAGTPPKKLSSGFNIIPSGSYVVTLSQGVSLTKKDASLLPFRINKLDAELVPQQTLKKIARGANECVFGDAASLLSGTVYSYECIEPPSIFVNKYEGFSRKTIFAGDLLSPLNQPQAYKGGLVSLAYGDDGSGASLLFIDKNGQKTYPLTEAQGYPKQVSYKLFAGADSLSLLDPESKTIYSLSSLAEKPKVEKLGAGGAWAAEHTVLRQYKDKFYIFTGNADTEDSDSLEKGTFYVFNLGGGDPIKTIEINEHASEFSNFSVINEGLVYSTSLDQKTTVFSLAENKLEERGSIASTQAAVAVNGEIYALVDRNVYRFNPQNNNLNLVFASAKIKVTAIQSVDNRLVINGYSNTEADPANQTYLLEDKPIESDYRLEDILPYGDIDTPLAWMDYFGDEIYVSLGLKSLRKDLGTGNYVFDQGEYNSASAKIQQQLDSDGFTKDKYTIRFSGL